MSVFDSEKSGAVRRMSSGGCGMLIAIDDKRRKAVDRSRSGPPIGHSIHG